MKWRSLFLALATAAAATLLSAQGVTSKTTTIESSDNPKIITISGEVVRFQPGQTIVIRQAGKETTYTLSPSVTLPADIQIGRTVTLSTEPASDGSGPAMVTKVTTTSMTPEGQTKTTTERTEKTTTTTISGTVSAFEPGQFITIEKPDHQTVQYTINQESQLPQDVAVGKTVTIRTYTDNGTQYARQVTITKTKTKTKY
jgi:quercetin dioxygenase-like cupin family protein